MKIHNCCCVYFVIEIHISESAGIFFLRSSHRVHMISMKWFHMKIGRSLHCWCSRSNSSLHSWKLIDYLKFIFSSARLQNRKSFRMNSEPVPLVTTLLRGSRDSNEILLKEVFRKILDSGISKENLNAVDKSGRVSLTTYAYSLWIYLHRIIRIHSRLWLLIRYPFTIELFNILSLS